MLWALNYKGDPRKIWVVNYWFSVSEYLLLRISECLNPVFYNLGSNQMRRCTMKLLKQMVGQETEEPNSTSALETSNTNNRKSRAITVTSQDESTRV